MRPSARQKGPFLNGTATKVSEPDGTLIPTGKTFTTRLLDNREPYVSFKLYENLSDTTVWEQRFTFE